MLTERDLAAICQRLERWQGFPAALNLMSACAKDVPALLREVDRLRAVLERIACRDQGEVGSHMEEPRAAAIAREVLG